MRIVLILFSLIVFPNVSFSQDSNIKIDSITIEKSDDLGNTFSFTFSYKDFNNTNHDVSKLDEMLIDGKPFQGTDGVIPSKEIKDFSLKINDHIIPIDPDFYKNFFNPMIGSVKGDKYIGAFWGDNSSTVYVFMNASDGAGTYSVVWTLRADGEHSYSIINDDVYFKFD